MLPQEPSLNQCHATLSLVACPKHDVRALPGAPSPLLPVAGRDGCCRDTKQQWAMLLLFLLPLKTIIIPGMTICKLNLITAKLIKRHIISRLAFGQMLLNLATEDSEEETAVLFRKLFGIKEGTLPAKLNLSKFLGIGSVLFELPSWRFPEIKCFNDRIPGTVGKAARGISDAMVWALPFLVGKLTEFS